MAFRTQIDDFAGLYERTYQAVYRTVLGICCDATLAADVAQDTFLAAYRQRATYRGDVPVEAWLHRIAVNTALTALRKRRVRWAEPLDATRHDRPMSQADGATGLDLVPALLRLDPRARAAVVLRYYVDLDYASIATILETSSGNVGSMLSRALDRLRHDLDWAEPRDSAGPSATREARHGG